MSHCMHIAQIIIEIIFMTYYATFSMVSITLLNNVDKSLLLDTGCYNLYPMFICTVISSLLMIVPIAISFKKYYNEVMLFRGAIFTFACLIATRLWMLFPFINGVLQVNDHCKWLNINNTIVPNTTNMSHTTLIPTDNSENVYKKLTTYTIYTDMVLFLITIILIIVITIIALHIERFEKFIYTTVPDFLNDLFRKESNVHTFYKYSAYGSTDTLQSNDNDPDNPRNAGIIYQDGNPINPYLKRGSNVQFELDFNSPQKEPHENLNISTREILAIGENTHDSLVKGLV